ncbi:glycosyltransferase family A protein [Microbulbifer pacificus]|uniref:Glycosyltransferase family A protein n=1 Tax=Microbulbifer pacificus TaxID=407164 RepID=A0AAU0MVJ6_9GAMM|nr:glycosyltransferase family A protein [Microbulbifer pacificus]WOX04477.1 glycosyltransferase family A protein [Microbulbifer pacificus]
MFSYFMKKRLRKHDAVNNRKLESILRVQLLQQQALNSTTPGVGNDKEHHIVVSLTSFDKRIDNLFYTVESLFQQWVKADAVVLWLSTKNFPDRVLPASLESQKKRGLQVHFVEEDFGPYKKYCYAFEHFPDSLIITVDDDTLYPPDMIDQLYRAWLRNPNWIHCHRAHFMRKDRRGKLLSYDDWDSDWRWSGNDGEPSLLVFPTGVGGVLYFPGALHPDAFDHEKFMRLCPNADDVWLKAMSLKQGTLCARVPDSRNWSQRFLSLVGSQDSALKKENWRKRGGNDCKIRTVFEYYDLYKMLD